MNILGQRRSISKSQRLSGRAMSSRAATKRMIRPGLTGHRFPRRVVVPSQKGIRVETVVNVNRPLAEVYSFWRRLENLPRFMRHLESVTVLNPIHSHWKMHGLAGKTLEW